MAIAIDLLCWVLQLGPILVLSFTSNPLNLEPLAPSRQAHDEEQKARAKTSSLESPDESNEYSPSSC